MNEEILNFMNKNLDDLEFLEMSYPQSDDEDYMKIIHLALLVDEEKNKLSDGLIDYDDEIIDIEYLGEMETVDISVTGDQLFYCNGILTKNSMGIAHVSDCIMSIFQSDEDMELGIIKLGMIKNRYGARGMVQPMRIEYETLTVVQSDESEEIMDEENLSILERLSK